MEDIKYNIISKPNNNHPQSEKENIYPNKNKRGKNIFLNEELPKNSILFNVNYKPDIIINHQTSNNIRTNININPSPYNKNKYNQQNYFTQNKYYTIDDNKKNAYKRNKVEETPILNNGFIHDKIEILTKAFILGENNLNKEQKKNYINYKDLSQKDKNLSNISNNRVDIHTKNNNKFNKINHLNNNKDEKSKKDIKNNIYEKNSKNNLYIINNGESNPKYDYVSDLINPLKYYSNNKNNNNNNKYSNNLEYLELKKNIFKNKHQRKNSFSPFAILNNIIERKKNSNINGYNIYKYNNKILNANFNYYQIRAFKKIFKYINQLYKNSLKQYYNYFLDKIIQIINSKKAITQYDNEIINNKVNTGYKSYINKDLVNIYDKLPIRNKLYKKINNRNINKNNNNSVFNNLTSKRNASKDLSPFLKFGNETILLNDISFKTEDSKVESELYRDSNELKKKYQQILIRKRRSKLKNNNLNRTFDHKKSEYHDSDSNLNKIRNYMQLTDKKENIMQEDSITNKIRKNLNRIKKLDYSHKKNNNRYGNNKGYDKEVNILENDYKRRKNNIFNQSHDKLKKNHNITKNYAFTVLIKNICTKDGRIHIYINYYFLLRNNSPLKTIYNNLKPSNYFSITYIINKNNKNSKFSSIIEEESQNPYFYYDHNKNYNDKINNKINNNYKI